MKTDDTDNTDSVEVWDDWSDGLIWVQLRVIGSLDLKEKLSAAIEEVLEAELAREAE